MKIRLVRTERDFKVPFPEGPEKCANALFFKVGLGLKDKFEVAVAYASRDAHSKRNRRRFDVGLKTGNTYRSLVQFEGTDDYQYTGDCACVIKRPENNEFIPVNESVPLEYAGHRVVILSAVSARVAGTIGAVWSTRARLTT